MKKGISVVVFPEGTRSPDGEAKDFKRGAFLPALQSRAPIVPISIFGTYEIPPRADRAFFPLSREPGEGVSRSRPDKGLFGAEHAATAGISDSGGKTPLVRCEAEPLL